MNVSEGNCGFQKRFDVILSLFPLYSGNQENTISLLFHKRHLLSESEFPFFCSVCFMELYNQI